MKLVDLIDRLVALNRELGNVDVLDGIGQPVRGSWSYHNSRGEAFVVVDTETPE